MLQNTCVFQLVRQIAQDPQHKTVETMNTEFLEFILFLEHRKEKEQNNKESLSLRR